MGRADSTCWTIIAAAAAGGAAERDSFARRYESAIRTYLAARWRESAHLQDLEDAVQETFVELFKDRGILEKADASRPGGFRAFLYGAVRRIALRVERRLASHGKAVPPAEVEPDEVAADAPSLAAVFDRAWARQLIAAALDRMAADAMKSGTAAQRRFELLYLRFREGLPVREIAGRWGADPTRLHRDFTRGCREFKAAVIDAVAFHHPGNRADVDHACQELIASLG